jgi:hypothetical protein
MHFGALAAATVLLAVFPLPAPAAAVMLGGGPPGSIVEAIAGAVPDALRDGPPIVVQAPVAGIGPLDALAGGRVAAALLHGDVFRTEARRSSAVAELDYFPLRRACFVLLVLTEPAADASTLLASAATPAGGSIDIGAAGSLTAGSWAALAAAHPSLASVRTEARGGLRAISRLLNQQISAVLLSSLEIAPGGVAANAVIDGLARFVPLDNASLWRSAEAAGVGYQRRQLTVEDPRGGAPGPARATLCTDLGIAVSDAASPGIADAIAAAANAKRLTGNPRSLLDRAADLWSFSVSQATGLIGRTRTKVGQAAWEIAPRWFAHP